MSDAGPRLEANRQVIDEFCANGGVVGGQFDGLPLLLLTSTGARSGATRTSPALFLGAEGRYVIVAANGGRDTDPAWCANVAAAPDVTVEVGSSTFAATASFAAGAERDRLLAAVVAQTPLIGDLVARTARPVPVVVLTPYD